MTPNKDNFNLRNRLESLSSEQLAKLRSKMRRRPVVKRSSNDFMKFGLFFFSDEGSHQANRKYEFLIESAKFADQHNFHSLWVPERHFHEFGGPYPSPAVLLSALAMVTQSLQLRSGSVVVPLHHPVRIAEEWSVIDNLSGGRVGFSAASGWSKDDFIFAREPYEKRKQIMFSSIKQIQRLWRGETHHYQTLDGHTTAVKIFPEPLQEELPIWVTSASNPKTWEMAASIGANVLTGLMEQSIDELAEKIALYKAVLNENGHDSDTKEISVMMHTYVGEDLEIVKKTVKPAMVKYLKTHMSVYEKQLNHAKNSNIDLSLVSEKDRLSLIELGFERYFSQSALLGTVKTCSERIQKLRQIGVTEVCSLLNFGLDYETIFYGLNYLNQLKEQSEVSSKEII